MTEPEKKKHAKNLKRLKKDLRKQKDQYMKVPDYLKGTLTRKYYEEISERKLTKGELKDRERIAQDLPDAEFKKRYGKDWKSVKIATATKLAKKEGMYPPYKADQVQKVRYQASDTFTNSPKQAKKRGYLERFSKETIAKYKNKPESEIPFSVRNYMKAKGIIKSKKTEAQAGTGEIYVYNEIGIKLKNYDGQVLPGDVIRAPKGFPLGGKKLEKSLALKVTKSSRKGINKYRLSLEDPKTGKKYSVMNFKMDGKYKGKELPQWSMIRRSEKNIEEKSNYVKKHGKDPVKGTGKKPKGSGRRLYTDENPSDTVKVKFSTRQDIIDTLNKASFKAKPHKRQSQIINLIHQRVRAALNKAKDPAVKKRLRSGFEYIKKRKEASKRKTQRMKKENAFTKDWWKEIIKAKNYLNGD